MKTEFSISNISLKYGLSIGAILIGYFLLMKVLGLLYILELRYLNFLFLSVGLSFAFNKLRHQSKEGIDYFDGMGLGLFTALVAGGIFAIFLYLYLSFIDPAFMTYLTQHAPFGQYLTSKSTPFIVMMEGDVMGVVFSFVAVALGATATCTRK